MSKDILDYTGERMVPEKADLSTFWEHICRYQFACRFIRNQRVLDVACGEGYGTAALVRAGAKSVVGVDIAPEVVEHARRKYGVNALVGDASGLPIESSSVDVVVSFETIEHVEEPSAFVAECARVCAPGGLLVISTPNKAVYSAAVQNPFHCSELTPTEFTDLLQTRFENIRLFAQQPAMAPWWSSWALAAEHTPLQRVRGFMRIQGMLRRLICPQLFEDEEVARGWARDKISQRGALLEKYVSPFAVRSCPRDIERYRPKYLIAVATRSER